VGDSTPNRSSAHANGHSLRCVYVSLSATRLAIHWSDVNSNRLIPLNNSCCKWAITHYCPF